jgi:hypothetical protein
MIFLKFMHKKANLFMLHHLHGCTLPITLVLNIFKCFCICGRTLSNQCHYPLWSNVLHHLKHVNGFQKHTSHNFVVASNVGSMDICTTSLLIISPSLMAEEMVILTHYTLFHYLFSKL